MGISSSSTPTEAICLWWLEHMWRTFHFDTLFCFLHYSFFNFSSSAIISKSFNSNKNEDICKEILTQIDLLYNSLLISDSYREMIDDRDVNSLCNCVDIFNIQKLGLGLTSSYPYFCPFVFFPDIPACSESACRRLFQNCLTFRLNEVLTLIL